MNYNQKLWSYTNRNIHQKLPTPREQTENFYIKKRCEMRRSQILLLKKSQLMHFKIDDHRYVKNNKGE